MLDKKSTYDESKIKTLSSLEHIRLRTGMYIGRLGDGSNLDDGIYILVKEVVDNAIDEFISGFGKKVVLKLNENLFSIRDYGRGIPLGKIVECVSVINTGAKYNDDVFQFSVGLNGVGTKAVNALSSHFKVTAYRNGNFSQATFSQGNIVKQIKKGWAPDEPDGTYVEFTPDPDIFSEFAFKTEFIEQRLWNYAYLNSGLKIYFNKQKFVSKNGLLDLLGAEVGDKVIYDIIYHKSPKIEFAFTHTNTYGENYFSFVNGQYTKDGGTHQGAFREGILKGINEFFKKNYSGVDVREGIVGSVSIKLKSPVFESQTKNKLGNTEIKSWIINDIKSALLDVLFKNKELSKQIEQKINNNERLRKELNAVKKEAKEAAKKISIKIPNLKDCKYHTRDGQKGSQTMIFITEGQSASGSMVSSRDVNTQAIFSLKGKPLNIFGKKRTAIYQNDELFNMMMALQIEDNVDHLRYGKIIIATDADNDGFHIRNLLLTFFLHFFEEIIIRNKVFILETPLFRVRNKKQTVYCYSEKEKTYAFKQIKAPEVTRFKGLGEISPKEFGQFIGDDMRLSEVNVKSIKDIPEILEFYMGKNTPERRDYIMENLI